MRTSFRIFTAAGIEVRVHLSLLIILVLLIYAFYVSPQPYGFADFQTSVRLVLSVLAAVLLFAAVLAHEYAHSLVAMRYGVKVRGIMLFIFGGVAMMESIPKTPGEELRISLAGPATSLAIAVISFAASYVPLAELSALFRLFGYFNALLAIFNLLPAFPMDGGRVLRSLLAKRMSYVRATRIAAETGKMLAVFMGITGIFYNPWLILIALFIYIGASEEERLVTIESILGSLKVRDLMTEQIVTVKPDMRVGELIDFMLKFKHLGYPVVENGELVGIVTLKDVINADPGIEVRNVMTRNVITVTPETSAFEAFKIMSERNIGRLPVVESGRLVGIISRSDLMNATEILEVMEVLGWKRSS